jgi:hypothetical protein
MQTSTTKTNNLEAGVRPKEEAKKKKKIIIKSESQAYIAPIN